MFGAPINNGLTFTKLLGGISKTLSIANQVIPIYREAKPMINNAKTILSVLKGMNTSNSATTSSNSSSKINLPKKDTLTKPLTINTNSPKFFQ